MKKRMILFLVIFSLMVIPTGFVAAAGEIQPSDPGAGSSQDVLIKATLDWLIRQPPTLSFSTLNITESINRASLDAIARGTESYGYLPFTGFDASLTRMNSFKPAVFLTSSVVLIDTPPPPGCPSTIEEGEIILTANKDAPANPVVVGQDPNHRGVDLTWTLNIFPTVYTFGVWTDFYAGEGKCKTSGECIINSSDKKCCGGYMCVPHNSSSGNGHCEVDPNAGNQYGCVENTITYRENIGSLTPKTILTEASRTWILNILDTAYPGISIKHPASYDFPVTKPCVWQGDTCVWTHTQTGVQVADPGWYDLMISGTTTGTAVFPPREFTRTDLNGRFGVKLIESSLTGQN
jgi:hypothetical protein